ncbi:MAG: hypothetical protein LBG96_08190 [Tannerella sp.]|jgi:hypothetical protein|nr:hypothetical protein [Tannerella sp.]
MKGDGLLRSNPKKQDRKVVAVGFGKTDAGKRHSGEFCRPRFYIESKQVVCQLYQATSYIIRWGVKKDQLKNTTMIMSNNFIEAGYFNLDSEYFFSIDSFNENGITKGTEVFSVK